MKHSVIGSSSVTRNGITEVGKINSIRVKYSNSIPRVYSAHRAA